MQRASFYFPTFAVSVALLSAVAQAQEGAGRIQEAGAKFQKNCMSCHQPPDRRFASDRAWIGQIRETS